MHRCWFFLVGEARMNDDYCCIYTYIKHLLLGVMQGYYFRNQTFSGHDLLMRLTFVGVSFLIPFTACMFIGNILYSMIGLKSLQIIGIVLFTTGLVLSSFINSVSIIFVCYFFSLSLPPPLFFYTGFF